MRLDIILPTYNRAPLLLRGIEAFLAARVPDGVEARLVVVDNKSSDATRATVAGFVERNPGRVAYLFEGRQGRHHALNAGIAGSGADVIGFFDDDEVIAPDWIEVVARELGRPGLDFIGGPYLPNWLAPRPPWYSDAYHGVVSVFDYGKQRLRYGSAQCPTYMLGGNAAVRRSVFATVGEYSARYTYAEDLDMYRRIIAAGFVGDYVPDLIIQHDIPAYRLTKRYFRHWVYTAARNDGKMERHGIATHHEPRLGGAPRWMWRRAAEGLLLRLLRIRRPDDPDAFSGELHAIELIGHLRGRWLNLPERHGDRSGLGMERTAKSARR